MGDLSEKNCIRISEQYWLFSTDVLFHFSIIPGNNMTLSARMNSLLRLSFLIFAILLLLDYKYSCIFILLAVLLNICLYLISLNMQK